VKLEKNARNIYTGEPAGYVRRQGRKQQVAQAQPMRAVLVGGVLPSSKTCSSVPRIVRPNRRALRQPGSAERRATQEARRAPRAESLAEPAEASPRGCARSPVRARCRTPAPPPESIYYPHTQISDQTVVYNRKQPTKEQARKEMIVAGCYDAFREMVKYHEKAGLTPEAAYWQSYQEVMGEGKEPPKPKSKSGTIVPVQDEAMASKMVAKKNFKKKTATPIENLQWVASHLCVEDVKPRDAPSSTAWGMLMWARSSPTTENIFWSNLFTKSMPTKQQLDYQASKNDASDVIRLIDEVARISKEVQDEPDG